MIWTILPTCLPTCCAVAVAIVLLCSRGPTSLDTAGAPPPAALAVAFAPARAHGCRSLSLGGPASPGSPPAGHPHAAAALGTPAPRSGRWRFSYAPRSGGRRLEP